MCRFKGEAVEPKPKEDYEQVIDGIPMRTELAPGEYDGIYITQDGESQCYPPKYILWLAERVREYYPGVKPFDPCKDGGS